MRVFLIEAGGDPRLGPAQAHQVERFLRGEHRAVAGARVIRMAVGDQRLVDRARRIDMKAAGLAAQTGGNGYQDVLRAHLGYIVCLAQIFSRHARA